MRIEEEEKNNHQPKQTKMEWKLQIATRKKKQRKQQG